MSARCLDHVLVPKCCRVISRLNNCVNEQLVHLTKWLLSVLLNIRFQQLNSSELHCNMCCVCYLDEINKPIPATDVPWIAAYVAPNLNISFSINSTDATVTD